jgi:hypothetical protein
MYHSQPSGDHAQAAGEFDTEPLAVEAELYQDFVCLTDELVLLGLTSQGNMLPYHMACLLFTYAASAGLLSV